MRVKYRIFDKPHFIDRYTLITEDNLMYGFNEIPYHPQGFGQFCGTWKGGSTRHLGRRVALEDLPEDAQRFVRERTGEVL